MTHYNNYLGRILQALSQLGNALSGGNPDISISARIGQKNKSTRYWRFATWVVDTVFEPWDGKEHCRKAYNRDKLEDYGETYIGKGPVFGLIVLTGIYVLACVVLSIPSIITRLVKLIIK